MEVVSAVEHIEKVKGRKALLAGDMVYCAMDQSAPPDFVPQPPRDAVGGFLAQFSRDTPRVFLWVNAAVLTSRLRFGIAFDGYLAWGLKQASKAALVLFGGGESAAGVNVDICTFADGRLIDLREKVLPHRQSHTFRDALDSMLDEVRMTYPSARLVQAGPLSDWEIDSIEYVGDKPLCNLSYRPISTQARRQTTLLIPAAIGIAGFVFYIGALLNGWGKYSAAVAGYEAAITAPAIKQQGGIDTAYLDTLSARRKFMDEPRRQVALASKAEAIVRGIATVANAKVLDLHLPAPAVGAAVPAGFVAGPDQSQRQRIGNDRQPDIWMSIAVPRSPQPALYQAKSVMVGIGAATGMSMRLTHQGWRDDAAQGRRIFSIEGFIHD